jgi:hypothetical protein
VDLIKKYRDQFGYALPGWRKAKDWRRRLKALERITSKSVHGEGSRLISLSSGRWPDQKNINENVTFNGVNSG